MVNESTFDEKMEVTMKKMEISTLESEKWLSLFSSYYFVLYNID